jgi:RNA polymerase sigma-70 factor (TIGR02960 family)
VNAEERAFAERVAPYRRELHVHCYRMLGSFESAEDLLQETLLRAWRSRERFAGEDGLRAWLYRIATNACLDELRRRARQAASLESFRDVPWLQPYPDRLLDEVAPAEGEPEAALVARETIELAYVAVIQALPPRQRAVLLLRDVLEWSARETAVALDMSVAAVTSALQRARATVQEHAARPAGEASELSGQERRLLEGFMEAHQSGDLDAALELLREDLRITMPPNPLLYEGREAMVPLFHRAIAMGDWLLVPSGANRMPTAASYLRRPGDTEFRAFKFDVMRVEDGLIAEITTFDPRLFEAFGLPAVWR